MTMTRHEVARIVLLYVTTLVGATGVWIVLFHTPLLAGSVLFYRGLILLTATAIVLTMVLVILWRTTYQGLIGLRDILLIATLLISVNVVFFTHLPVTADRSISVFILAHMNRADGPLTSEQIADSVVQEYLLDRGAIDKRLDEQLVTGTVVRSGDAYVISDEGRWLIGLYKVIASVFNIDSANLSP
jgi:hypothetical protein